ncbi:hypothetical protein FOA43_000908 [Brettanomyces nanus]|uniref:UBZ4-type domain-containing protein n=1 Tax=Eeniella nana TaxID=13502 RepID=A0A875RX58_EENNA|nr:uncharacterized protein FOA43_000908 [Brettanomyces nanus]QPG73596.1 hypothetical protein FOA43_000908 [Brettanomyces nanus]
MVKCPICSKDIALRLINEHLDSCEKVSDATLSQPSHINSLSDVLTGNHKKSFNSGYKYKDGLKMEDSILILDAEPKDTSSLASLGHKDKMIKLDPQPPPSLPISSGQARKQEQIRLLKAQSRLPLAERLRPTTLENYIGQEHLVGSDGILRGFIESDRIPSMILWGYPGTGKTTLARIISHRTKARFVELSATANGIADCKKVFQEAKHELKLTGRKTIVFVDEIHRFNKTQQDIFLPHVERGTVTLIGATTENPSFQLNSALLSRCRVFVLKKLSSSELKEIICRALVVINKTRKLVYNKNVMKLAPDAIDYLCNISDGDSRGALNLLELADSHFLTTDTEEKETVESDTVTQSIPSSKSTPIKNKHIIDITADDLRKVFKRTQIVYDRVGDAHYDTISAFHKSVRGSCPDAAIYYLARMLKGGEDPLYIARRMIRIASEDVGVVDDSCLPFAVAAYRAVQLIGLPEAELALVQCAVKLAKARKSVEIYRAWNEMNTKLDNEPDVASASIPLHLRNAPTKLMADLGYSENYKYNPDFKDGTVKQDYFPKELKEMKLLRGEHLGTKIDPDLYKK